MGVRDTINKRLRTIVPCMRMRIQRNGRTKDQGQIVDIEQEEKKKKKKTHSGNGV